MTPPEKSGETFVINTDYVNAHLGKLIEDEDLSRFILHSVTG